MKAKGYGTCKITATSRDGSKKKAVCKITVMVDKVQIDDLVYSLNQNKKMATVTGPWRTSIDSVRVPSTIEANGKKYKVTTIAAEAFKGMKKLMFFYTGENLTTIGASAFEDCTELHSIYAQSGKISKIGKNAFKNINDNPYLSLHIADRLTEKYGNKLIKLLKSAGIKKIVDIYD